MRETPETLCSCPSFTGRSLTSSANGNHYQSVNPIVYIWIHEMKRHYTTWLYMSFIVHRDIFASVFIFLCSPECAGARPYFGYLLVSLLDFLHANSRTVWLKGNWPQGINWNHVKTVKPSEDYDDDCKWCIWKLCRSQAIFQSLTWFMEFGCRMNIYPFVCSDVLVSIHLSGNIRI